jgi:dTDP-4-amino-4,6-dideoxygalactose transaminase
VKENVAGGRDALVARLAAAGVGAMVYYPVPIHRLPVYAHLAVPADALPNTNAACAEVMSLPMWPGIGEQVQRRVVDAVLA